MILFPKEVNWGIMNISTRGEAAAGGIHTFQKKMGAHESDQVLTDWDFRMTNSAFQNLRQVLPFKMKWGATLSHLFLSFSISSYQSLFLHHLYSTFAHNLLLDSAILDYLYLLPLPFSLAFQADHNDFCSVSSILDM